MKMVFKINDLEYFKRIFKGVDDLDDILSDIDPFICTYTIIGKEGGLMDKYELVDEVGNKININDLNGYQKGVVLEDCYRYFRGIKPAYEGGYMFESVEVGDMTVNDRVALYKSLFSACKAIEPVKKYLEKFTGETKGSDDWECLEAIRVLNTELSDLYQIEIPVITCWVRDSNYVQETREIYLAEPELEDFLHCFRHHLQNIERRYERRGLTVEGDLKNSKIPYEKTESRMYGEDDAIAWSIAIIDIALNK